MFNFAIHLLYYTKLREDMQYVRKSFLRTIKFLRPMKPRIFHETL